MPRYDSCSKCGGRVQRTATSAATITCTPCRRLTKHGTRTAYAKGCRCQTCKDAQAAAMRAYTAKRRAEGRPVRRTGRNYYETLQCDCCAKTFHREIRADRRRPGAYCSDLCRAYDKHGPLTCELPAKHWALLYGATSKWTPPQTFNCAWCETPTMTTGNRNTYCAETCRQRAKRVRRRGREHGAPGEYTWGQVTRLWTAFDQACAYCRTPTPLADIQAEHVIALANGGANNIGNILPSCAPCNADKRDLSMTAWEADRRRRNLPPVVTRWTWRDARYRHLTQPRGDLAA